MPKPQDTGEPQAAADRKERIRRLIDEAPPLTPEQKARLAVLPSQGEGPDAC
jgi:hypothetical protein